VGLYWVSGHAGVRGNETADELVRDGSVLKFLGNEPAVGVSRQDMRRGVRRWLVNQQWVRRQGLGDTQRQARELISLRQVYLGSFFLEPDDIKSINVGPSGTLAK